MNILCWEGSTQGTQALAEILAQNLWMWRKGSAPKKAFILCPFPFVWHFSLLFLRPGMFILLHKLIILEDK